MWWPRVAKALEREFERIVDECNGDPDFEAAARAALEASDRQSLSDRIDELEGVVDDAASCLKEAGHTISRLEHGSLGNRNFAYVAADHARAALHQEATDVGR